MGLIKPKKGGGDGFPNGTKWEKSSLPSTQFYNKICKQHGMYFACGEQSLLYSKDGITWTETNISRGVKDVLFANGIFVGFCYQYGFIYSSDGITWEYSNVTEQTGLSITDIYYHNGKFIGSEGTDFYSSDDGMVWEKQTIQNMSTFKKVNNIFFGRDHKTGSWYYSYNGVNWYSTILTGDILLSQIIYVNGNYLAYGLYIYKSKDGITWEEIANPLNQFIVSISYCNGLYIATTYDYSGYYSTDLVTWNSLTVENDFSLTVVANASYSCGIWVGSCISNIVYSYDGVNWKKAFTLDYEYESYFVTNIDGLWFAIFGSDIFHSITWRP